MRKKTDFIKVVEECTDKIKDIVLANQDTLIEAHRNAFYNHNSKVLEENKNIKEENRMLMQQLNALSRFSSQTIDRLDIQDQHKKDMLLWRTRENHLIVMKKLRSKLKTIQGKYNALLRLNENYKKNGIVRKMAYLLSTGNATYWRMEIDDIIDAILEKKGYNKKIAKITGEVVENNEEI